MSRSNTCAIVAMILLAITMSCTAVGVNTTCESSYTDNMYYDFQKSTDECGASCQTDYCTCLGLTYSSATSGNMTSATCSGTATPSCAVIEGCMRARVVCYHRAAQNPTTACTDEAAALKVALVALAASTPYANSAVENSCKRMICTDFVTMPSTINLRKCGANDFKVQDVCQKDKTRPAAPAVVAQLRFGNDLLEKWLVNKVAVEAALRKDIARLLGLDLDFIVLTSVKQGSLIVDFNVFADTAAGISGASLEAAVAALATKSSQFTAVLAATGLTALTAPTVTQSKYEGFKENKCDKGCIAGIVIGSFAFVVILVVVGVVLHKRFAGTSTGVKAEPTEDAGTV